MNEWIAPVLSLIGAAVGASLQPFLQTKSARRIRLEDAYADLASAAHLMIEESASVVFGAGTRKYEEATRRFNFTRAKVLLQESDVECRRALAKLSASLSELTLVRTPLGDDPSTDKDHLEGTVKHLMKMRLVEDQLLELLERVRQQINQL